MRPNEITLWRQIEESLSTDIVSGRLATNQRLPSSDALAARFGVNRHTVRKAIARLEAEGLVRIERGRGTYAVVNSLEYNLGPLQLFEQNLHEQNLVPTRTVLSVLECIPPREAANALEISSSEHALSVITLGEADGMPVNYGQHYIASSRLPGIADAFRAFLGKKRSELLVRIAFRELPGAWISAAQSSHQEPASESRRSSSPEYRHRRAGLDHCRDECSGGRHTLDLCGDDLPEQQH